MLVVVEIITEKREQEENYDHLFIEIKRLTYLFALPTFIKAIVQQRSQAAEWENLPRPGERQNPVSIFNII